MIHTLKHYGIRGSERRWFESYLSERKQYVVCREHQSNKHTYEYTLPQGSSLAPVLLIIFVNDIIQSSNIMQFLIYADDTNLFTFSDNLLSSMITANQELCK